MQKSVSRASRAKDGQWEGPAAAMGCENVGVGEASGAGEGTGSGRRGGRVGPGCLRAGAQLRSLGREP